MCLSQWGKVSQDYTSWSPESHSESELYTWIALSSFAFQSSMKCRLSVFKELRVRFTRRFCEGDL